MSLEKYKETLIPCPVCATPFFDPEDFPGSYFICPICGWEDDNVQYDEPDYEGGANDVSLNQARENYKLYGISDLAKKIIPPNHRSKGNRKA